MSPDIRQAQPEDAAHIHHLIYQLAQYEQMEHVFSLDVKTLEKALFEDKTLFAKVALIDGEIKGVALYYVIFATFKGQFVLKLEDLIVEESLRNQNIGKRLIQSLAQEASQKGYASLSWSCLTWNTPALMLYHRLGARIVNDWLHFKLEGEALTQLLADDFPYPEKRKDR